MDLESWERIVVKAPGLAPVVKRPPAGLLGTETMAAELVRLHPCAEVVIVTVRPGKELWAESARERLASAGVEPPRPQQQEGSARAALRRLTQMHAPAEWHDDDGPALWWNGDDLMYIGGPLCLDWPGAEHFTFWTRIPNPEIPPDAAPVVRQPEPAAQVRLSFDADGFVETLIRHVAEECCYSNYVELPGYQTTRDRMEVREDFARIGLTVKDFWVHRLNDALATRESDRDV